MARWITMWLVYAALAGCSNAPAVYTGNNPPTYESIATRPFTGKGLTLVLGSGGARGFTHVGILKGLWQENICPDLVVGTSAGSIIGALYAAGLAPSEIERLALELGFADVIDPSFTRMGRVKGEKLEQLVNRLVEGKPIEQLKRRFVAVASKIPSGEMIVFNRGDTGAAVRASSATPGTFLPLRIGRETFVDGDLVAPVAVTAARRLTSGPIIAVDIAADLHTTPEVDWLPEEWVYQGIWRKRLTEFEVAQADLVIRPVLPYFAPRSDAFKRLTIARGEAAVKEALPKIRALGSLPTCD